MSSTLFTIPIQPPRVINPPTLTGNRLKDVEILRKFDQRTLLGWCASDEYIFNVCNESEILFKIITEPL